MKRGTPENRKTRRLAMALNVPRYSAVGLLELLWHFAARECLDGLISRATPDEIAEALFWPDGDSDRLIDAFIETGWIDRDGDSRLVLHHWPEHCDDAVHTRLARSGDLFADGTLPRASRLSKRERKSLPDEGLWPERTASAQQAHGERTAEPKPSRAKPGHSQAETEFGSEKRSTTPRATSAPAQNGASNLGEAIAGLRFGGFTPDELLKRVLALGNDGPQWRAWWQVALGHLAAFPDALGAFLDQLDYVSDCADPSVRSTKDLGELKHPGRFLTSKVLEIARAHKIKLPNLPSAQPAKARAP